MNDSGSRETRVATSPTDELPQSLIQRIVDLSRGAISEGLADGLRRCELLASQASAPSGHTGDTQLSGIRGQTSVAAAIRALLEKAFPPIIHTPSPSSSSLYSGETQPDYALPLRDSIVYALARSRLDQSTAMDSGRSTENPLLSMLAIVALANSLGLWLNRHFCFLPDLDVRAVDQLSSGSGVGALDVGFLFEIALFGGIIGAVFEGEDPALRVEDSTCDFRRVDRLYIVRCSITTNSIKYAEAFELPFSSILETLESRSLIRFELEGLRSMPIPLDHIKRSCSYINAYRANTPRASGTSVNPSHDGYSTTTESKDWDIPVAQCDLDTMSREDDEGDSDNSAIELDSRLMGYPHYHERYATQRADGRWMARRSEPFPDSDVDSNGSW